MLCSICFSEIEKVGDWDSGNNASPVNTGRCCNTCDNAVVIPARLRTMLEKIPQSVYIDMLREQHAELTKILAAFDAHVPS